MKSSSIHLLLSGTFLFLSAAFVGWQSADVPARPVGKALAVESSARKIQSERGQWDLKKFRALKNDRERMRLVIEMARSLPASEIGAWIEGEKFTMREGYALNLFKEIAFQRWSDEAPADFLAWAIQNGSLDGSIHVAKIIENYPEVVSDAMASPQDFYVWSKLLNRIVQVNPDLALAEFRKSKAEEMTISGPLQSILKRLVEARPTEMARLLNEFPDSPNSQLLNAVFQHKLKHNFEQGFQELISRPDGFQIFFSSSQSPGDVAAKQFLSRLGDLPAGWRAQLATSPDYILQAVGRNFQVLHLPWEELGFDDSQGARLRQYFTERGARRDPVNTFAMLDDHNFTTDQKQEFFRNALMHGHSDEEWSRIAGALSDPDDRAVFQEMLTEKQNTPRQVLGSVDDLTARLEQGEPFDISAISSGWGPAQQEELVAAFRGFDDEQKSLFSEIAISTMAFRLPVSLQSQAITHVLNNPHEGLLEENRANLENLASMNAVNLLRKDPAELTSWLRDLPEGGVSLQIKKNIARIWPKMDPEASQKWLASQSEREQAAINDFLRPR